MTTDVVFQSKVLEFERCVLEQSQVDIPVRHYFSKNVYAREITIPAGTYGTGALHRFENMHFLLKGRIIVATEEGTHEFVAPCTMISPPGIKRAFYAPEETVWTTIVGTPERDVSKIVDEFLAPSYTALSCEENAQLSLF